MSRKVAVSMEQSTLARNRVQANSHATLDRKLGGVARLHGVRSQLRALIGEFWGPKKNAGRFR